MDWRHRAACRDEDPELFWPVGNSGPALLQIAEAKTVCRRCPVASACLSWAMETGQEYGVWGGLSEDERRALQRRNARTRARSTAEPPSKPAQRQPLVRKGHVQAAPREESISTIWNNTVRSHVPDATGTALCGPVKLDLSQARSAVDVPVGERCRLRACRDAIAAADAAGPEIAIARTSQGDCRL